MAARAAREHQSGCQPSPRRHPAIREPEPSGEGSLGTRENFWTRWPGADWLGAHGPLQQQQQLRWPMAVAELYAQVGARGDAPVHTCPDRWRSGGREQLSAPPGPRCGWANPTEGCCSHVTSLDHPDPSSCHWWNLSPAVARRSDPAPQAL